MVNYYNEQLVKRKNLKVGDTLNGWCFQTTVISLDDPDSVTIKVENEFFEKNGFVNMRLSEENYKKTMEKFKTMKNNIKKNAE